LIKLKKLSEKKHISSNYLKWMNDYEVHKYTEQKYEKHTKSKIKKFVKTINKSKNNILYGIFFKNIHIGNIKLGYINKIHKTADISYFIGEEKYVGKGYATIAIRQILAYSKKIGLRKITAGCYSINKGSIKVLKKNGFKREGVLKKQILFNKKRYDQYMFGKLI
tara:strand:+ start:106 stop:600 length:495 start_codon:yes stop_codon:yes gene_type:complete